MRFFTCLFIVLFISSCATVGSNFSNKNALVDTKIYEPDIIQSINTWGLKFKYDAYTIESKKDKTIQEGQLSSNVQLIDDLFFSIKDETSINVSKSNAEGIIYLNINNLNDSYILSIDCTVEDNIHTILARIKIKYSGLSALTNDDALHILFNELRKVIKP